MLPASLPSVVHCVSAAIPDFLGNASRRIPVYNFQGGMVDDKAHGYINTNYCS